VFLRVLAPRLRVFAVKTFAGQARVARRFDGADDLGVAEGTPRRFTAEARRRGDQRGENPKGEFCVPPRFSSATPRLRGEDVRRPGEGREPIFDGADDLGVAEARQEDLPRRREGAEVSAEKIQRGNSVFLRVLAPRLRVFAVKTFAG